MKIFGSDLDYRRDIRPLLITHHAIFPLFGYPVSPKQVDGIRSEMNKIHHKCEEIRMSDNIVRKNKRTARRLIKLARKIEKTDTIVSAYEAIQLFKTALGIPDVTLGIGRMWSSGLTQADREGGAPTIVEQVPGEPVKTPCHPEGIPGSRYEPHPHFVTSDLDHISGFDPEPVRPVKRLDVSGADLHHIVEFMVGDRKFIPSTDLDELQDQFNGQADELRQAEDTIEVRDDRIKDLEADIAAAVELINRAHNPAVHRVSGAHFRDRLNQIKKVLFAHEPRKPKGGIIVYGGATAGMAEAMKAADEGFDVTIVEGTAPHKTKG